MATHKRTIYDHFSRIASFYGHIRTTDAQPIRYIGKKLKGSKAIRAADIGCGTGRYDLLLFRYLNNLHLTKLVSCTILYICRTILEGGMGCS